MRRLLLIVDDVRLNRIILKKLLIDDYDILEAADGSEAMDIIYSSYESISAVILDLSMPVMDGFGVLTNMRSDAKLRQIPVIITTGQTEEASEVKALKLGANDYISKPYNATIIKQRIWNVINLRETASAVNELRRDYLTGLYSRSAFFETAAAMIAEKPAGYYVISCFDIDNFKVINDQYGIARGDEILRNIADIFSRSIEPFGGICSRIMADNYALLYPISYLSSSAPQELHRKLCVLDGSIQPISFSVGRYIVDDLSLSVSSMYDRATMAESSVKGRYDKCVAMFDESMREKLLAEQKIVAEMNGALSSGQFEPWFQPQYNHATGELVGAEALVRWRHPEKGLIPPAVFIPLFEKNGFIYELDKYIWEQVCRCLRRWLDEGRNPLPVSVNISRYDVYKDDLPDFLAALIVRYRLPVGLLNLEITESAFSDGASQIISTVRKLVDYGFTVEIDDFGSGYSSLNTLKDVPAQIIKLDMKFLESTDTSPRGGNILESIIRMAKWIDMSVIAEGVETAAQADFLKSIGCFYVQGYLYARPIPLAEYEALAGQSRKNSRTGHLRTLENLDNNTFWSPESIDTLIFNSYLGGACVYEYCDGNVELLRANDKYIKLLGSVGLTMDTALKLNWSDYLDSRSLSEMAELIERTSDSGEETIAEFIFHKLPGCAEKTYIRSTMRVIASTDKRKLVYCISENISAQRIAEKNREETFEQLQFLESMAHELLGQTDFKSGIDAILRKLLDFFGGDRAYVFEFDFERALVSNTYELCAEGVYSERQILQNIPMDTVSFWLHAFDSQNYYEIENVSALADSRPEKALLQEQNISSLVAVPLNSQGKLTGFLGVDNPKMRCAQISRLSALGDYISVMLMRRDMNT